jgi:hypothetical protein
MLRIGGTLSLLAALTLPAPGQAGTNFQFTLLDTVYIHSTATKAFSFFPLPAGVPANWRTPIDYAGGRIHMRLEVRSKPSANAVNYQVCIFQDQHSSDKHACARYQKFTALGTYLWDQDLPSIYQYAKIDWTRAMLDTMLVVKDGAGNPVDDRYGFAGAWEGSPNFSLYYPMEVRFSAVVVAKGSVFQPPAWWTSTAPSPTPVPPPGTLPPPTPPPPGGNPYEPAPAGLAPLNARTLCGNSTAVATTPSGSLALGALLALVFLLRGRR